MPDLKSLSPEILHHLAKLLHVLMKGLLATIELLDEGGTVPFIARYRKEATGNLDEVQIRTIEEKLLYFRELQDRKATIAHKKGFDPLAQYLWAQQLTNMPLNQFAATFGDPAEALEGARHIVAETIGENAAIRQRLRKIMWQEGVIVSRKIADAGLESKKDERQKFKMYYDYREPVKSIPSHRMLAIRRGETESVLYLTIELDPQRPTSEIASRVHKQPGDLARTRKPGASRFR